MTEARTGASAVRLADGRVLITGGIGANGVIETAELYGATGSFSRVAPMLHSRSEHVSVALEDGRVLVAGGRTRGDAALSSAEIYDPAADAWKDVGVMNVSRVGHTATRLADGRVLIAGGEAGGATHASVETLDSGSNRFEYVSSQLSSARTRHGAGSCPGAAPYFRGGRL